MISLLRRVAVALVVVVPVALAGCGTDDDVAVPVDPTIEAPEVGEPPEAGEPPPEESADVERQMERLVFDLVNDERRERGLEPLEWDDQLAELAREWSSEMADQGRLEHQDPERMLERSEGFTGVGENIFRATGPLPASTIHVSWMRSDGHRANVLRPEFDRLGVGFLCTGDGEVWATQRFGRTGTPSLTPPEDDIPPEQPIVGPEGEGPTCPAARGDLEIELR